MSAVFVSCAITGGMSVPSQSAAIPVTPDEIVEAAVGAHAAGAAIVHIHVREPSAGKPGPPTWGSSARSWRVSASAATRSSNRPPAAAWG